MGLWDIISTLLQAIPGVTPTQPGISLYELMQKYFGAESNSLDYDKATFNQNLQEAKNLGLVIPKDVEKAFKELAKNGNNWFYQDGSLQEGLSDKDAKKAKKYKTIASTYYQKVKPEPQENIRARWAARNFITNGFDTSAAKQYSTITDYNLLANLWGGDIKGALSGGYYGSKALANEQAYYNKLTAPQKRAYLLQRKQWIDQGLIKPYSGIDTNNLTMVTSADMENYMRDHINDWLYGFYGDNGYDDEYDSVHNPDLLSNALYAKYGLTPASNNGAWVPKGTIRTSGFTPTKVKNSRGSSKAGMSSTGISGTDTSGSSQSTGTVDNTKSSGSSSNSANDNSLKEVTETEIKKGLKDGYYNYKGYTLKVAGKKYYIDDVQLTPSKNGYLYYDVDGYRSTVGYDKKLRIIGDLEGGKRWKYSIKNILANPLYSDMDLSTPYHLDQSTVIYKSTKDDGKAISIDKRTGKIIIGRIVNGGFQAGVWLG